MEPEQRAARAGTEPAWLEDQVDLRQLVYVLWSGRWWIAGVTALAVLLAVLYLLAAAPTYQADALLRIEKKGAELAGMEALQKLTGGMPETAAQIEILQSRSVLGKTVDQLNLSVSAAPNRLPVLYTLFGDAEATQPADPRLGLDGYAWGGTTIEVGRMEVPDALHGEPFTLVARGDGRYRLLGPEDTHVLDGRVGKAARGRSDEGAVQLFVRRLQARPGTTFTLVSNSRLATIDALRKRMSINEQGKDTGVVQIRLSGGSQARIQETLDTITSVYLRQNTERRSAQARESLDFIEKQMPELRGRVEKAESRLADYQEKQQTVDLTVETEKLLEQLVDLDEKISGLETKKAEAARTYGPQHPVIEALNAQVATLRKEKKKLEDRVGNLPQKQREMLSLKRQLKVSTEVYTQMLNSAQELRVAKAGTIGNVHIVDDAAVADDPIAPRKALVLVLSVFLGGFGGCALVLGRRFFQRGVDTPDELEQRTGLSVYAVVPHCRALVRDERRYERGARPGAPLLAVDVPQDPATEAIRSLRTSLHFGLREPGNRVIAITSPGPGAGKSTISVNLALLLAETGQRVIVVDGDMRRGHLARYLAGGAPGAGLSEVLSGQRGWTELVQSLDDSDRAQMLTRGTTPPNPSELLLSDRYATLVGELRAAYDWVLIDAPPIMAVTDAAIIAHEASATFVIARSARDEVAEVMDAARRMEHGGARVTGLILNDYGARQVGRTYATHYYRYDYESHGKG